MKKVLIVDDEIVVHVALIHWLEQRGVIVIKAFDGEMGFAYFKQHLPEVVLTDTHMPKMNGWELAENIKQINSKTTLVATSGQEASKKLYPEGILFLKKPYLLQDALKLLNDL